MVDIYSNLSTDFLSIVLFVDALKLDSVRDGVYIGFDLLWFYTESLSSS